MDFETGKLTDVSRAQSPHRKREYRLLAIVVLITSLPWIVCGCVWPFETTVFYLFAGYFQVLLTFATSSGTDTSHHIRFLLCGSNPIGMTGGSSLLLGGVDALLDWREDAGERSRSPLRSYALLLYKFLMTPVGILLMLAEYTWDAVLMRRPGIVKHKWNELFSLANYHSLICPEKSNDIFYADLAVAKFRNDPWLYQWHRLRAMVFELEHYRIDANRGLGSPDTNIFHQSEFEAHQSLSRLRLAELQNAVSHHYEQDVTEFPVPGALAQALLRNARPIDHYLRMRQELADASKLPAASSFGLNEFVPFSHERGVYLRFLVCEILAHETEISRKRVTVEEHDWLSLVELGLITNTKGGYQTTDLFEIKRETMLDAHFVATADEEVAALNLASIPSLLFIGKQAYKPVTSHPPVGDTEHDS